MCFLDYLLNIWEMLKKVHHIQMPVNILLHVIILHVTYRFNQIIPQNDLFKKYMFKKFFS